MYRAYILSKSARSPRFRTKERTGCSAWLPMAMRFASCQSARLRLRVSSHGLSKASLERELVIATVSGSTTPVELRKIAQLGSMHE